MQGILDRVDPDGTLIVNGIAITVGPLSQVKGSLVSGAGVSLEGLFAPDGSIMARELRIRGRRAALGGVQATIRGLVEEVIRNRSGNASAIVINGVAIHLETLTQVKSGLDTGTPVLARALIVDGKFVAREIEDLDTSMDPPKGGRFVINGSTDDIDLDDQGQPEILKLNGRDFVVSSMAITGEVPVVGSAVEIQGDIDGGVLLATNIESERDSTEKQGRIEFDVQGVITLIINDENGNVAEFVVDGNRLSLQMLTLLDRILERGMVVQVAGIVSEGQLLASRIKQIEELP
jgi:DNA/RNA endonuclease YhcR with UshA esterase domain